MGDGVRAMVCPKRTTVQRGYVCLLYLRRFFAKLIYDLTTRLAAI
jgi:hypothetical protein